MKAYIIPETSVLAIHTTTIICASTRPDLTGPSSSGDGTEAF